MITTIEFKQGFIYKGVRHAWKKGKLYRLPFKRNKRTYGLREIPMYVFKTTAVYNIQRDKITFLKLKQRTECVTWEVEILIDDEYPF
jgi:hypothetical protein